MDNLTMGTLTDEVRFRADDADKAILAVRAMASGRSEQDVMRELLHDAAAKWEREYTIASRLLHPKGSAGESRGNGHE